MKHEKPDAPVIVLSALGSGALRVGADGATVMLGMKAFGLIVYLAEAASRPILRETLVDLLWERSDPVQGRGSLRQEVRRIKKALGDAAFNAAFVVTDSHIGLVEGRFAYDAAELAAAAAADDADSLARVLDLYRGDFLDDNRARAENFLTWATNRQTYYRDMAVAALVRLGAVDLAAGRVGRAQRAADRIIAIDSLHEPGHELLIRCHLANGRRGEARAHFERFRALILRELAQEPEKRLTDLVASQTPIAPLAPDLPRTAGRGANGRPTIAVLNVSRRLPDEFAYLADGVSEQLVSNLSKSAWLRVAALNPSPFLPTDIDVDRNQRDVRDFADYILRVDVRMHRRRVSILATLSRVADHETIFSDESEDEVEDVLALQRDMARRIASIFEPMVIDDQSRRESETEWRAPADPDHWRLLMRARWLFWTTRPKPNREAQSLLGQALKLSPHDVPTHCVLAFSHMLDAWSDWVEDPRASVAEAQRWARRAVQIAPQDGWAQFTLGVMLSTPEQLEQAKSHVSFARKLAPSLVPATGELARFHAFAGETAEAVRLADEALSLSPYDVHSGLWLRTKAFAAWIEEDHARALEIADFALTIRPAWFQNHYLRAAILAETGRETAARAALAEGARLMGRYSDAALRIGHPFSNAALGARFIAALNKAGGAFTV